MTTARQPVPGAEEHAARTRKATRLAGLARLRGIDSATLARLDDDGWAALAALAGVHPPSAATRAEAVGYLRGRETAEATAQPFGPGSPKQPALDADPFRGLPGAGDPRRA